MDIHSKVAELKAQYPTLKTGDDINGYIELTANEYEAKISEWAKSELDLQAKIAKDEAEALKAEADKAALLSKLGITANEAKLLLS